MTKYNIIISGVGGQGTLLTSRILGEYAMLMGMDCKLSEVHGMSQRGGSVVTYVKMGEKVYSPILVNKQADIILAFEQLESLRYIECLKDNGIVVYNTQKIMPMPVVSGKAVYPDFVHSELKKYTSDVVAVDAYEKAKELGNVKVINTLMIGVLAKKLGFDKEVMIKAFNDVVPPKLLELNLKAFEVGYNQ